MMRSSHCTAALLFAAALAAAPAAHAQTFTNDDPVLHRMWQLGMEASQAHVIAQQLMDSIGPRLTGSPGITAAHDWAQKRLAGWGVDARNEQYGTWLGWRRGITHVDLIEPRVRTLEAFMLAWSPGTGGRTLEGPVVVVPGGLDEAARAAWVASTRGKFVLLDMPQPTCRPASHFTEYGQPGALERLNAVRDSVEDEHASRVGNANRLREQIEAAGAHGALHSRWSGDIGVNKIFSTTTRTMPAIDIGCEDYGLLYRLAQNGQGPVIRVQADAEYLGEVPVYNTIGMLRGTELPDEYVMLSAHFDSWDGASGATDNGTGSTVMLEAMRILAQVYPNPKRTILVGLWGGEEQGLNGSRRFAGMHPDIVEGLQALFNQDNGTGRVVRVSMQGLVDAGAHWGRWLARVPEDISEHIDLGIPGTPGGGGSDYAAFICSGAPGFGISSISWSYGTHTWHTNRDTYDKVVFEEIRNNATLVAMLAYLASEDDRLSRERRSVLPSPRGNDDLPGQWPTCRPGSASSGG
jgi:carboxypeptidase Q